MSTPSEIVLIAYENLHFACEPTPSSYIRALAFETLVRNHIIQYYSSPNSDDCIHAFLSLYEKSLWPARKVERQHLAHPNVNVYPRSFVWRRDGRVAATTVTSTKNRGMERTEAMNVANSKLGMAVKAYVRAVLGKERVEGEVVEGEADVLVGIVTSRPEFGELADEADKMEKLDEADERENLVEDEDAAATS